MTHDLDEALLSLDLILDEENDRLGTPGFDLLPPELVAAKMRMVGLIEAEQGRLLRDRAADRVRPDDADCERSAMLLAGVLDKLTLNATLLERRIALCDDLMAAITAEAKRLSGGRSMVYRASGTLSHADQPTPIALNNSL
ncbi:flagellar biosynthesis protein FlgN [Sphingomonas aerolata]|uniref:flagellar biosynthesis protein FlgN n=1 Tax=Sphingomonas TaxID=13687 RepID=UPI002A6A0A48|nr:flagellar biosynthesis protein FlgN [Sphingomonas sp. CFBP9019]MDY1009926.1 flagellar biosynthesis protein FlgN [Sphingomonas sp. CFBP9019]